MKFILLMLLFVFADCSSAATGIPSSIQLCTTCHALDGSAINPEWPALTGQNKIYLLKQLKDIQKGKERPVPLMQGLLTNLTDDALQLMVETYAHAPRPVGRTPNQYVKRGQALYRGGDRHLKIPACIACHGPRGYGNQETGFPSLSGQFAPYTIKALHQFKTGVRKNDLNHIMRDISQRMSEDDIISIAYYLQGLY